MTIDSPQTLIDYIGKDKIANYLDALHKTIKDAVQKNSPQKKELNHE